MLNWRELISLRSRLHRLGDPRAAEAARRVFFCPCRFLGVPPERVRFLVRRVVQRHRRSGPVLDLARVLWRSPWHEEKVAAVYLAAAVAPRLGDAEWREFRRWVEGAPSDGHADAVAIQVLGRLVERDRAWCGVLRHWARSRSARLRRAALGAVVRRTCHMGDLEAAFSVCELLLRDREARVREAAAALLQDACDVDVAATQDFLERQRRLPPSLVRAVLSRFPRRKKKM